MHSIGLRLALGRGRAPPGREQRRSSPDVGSDDELPALRDHSGGNAPFYGSLCDPSSPLALAAVSSCLAVADCPFLDAQINETHHPGRNTRT